MTSWDVARLTVRLGDHNIKSDTEVKHVERRIKRVVRHRGFDMRTLYNDVAVLTMDSPVSFSHSVRPICLPSSSSSKQYSGSTGTVIGWGSLRESRFFLSLCRFSYQIPFSNLLNRWTTTGDLARGFNSNLDEHRMSTKIWSCGTRWYCRVNVMRWSTSKRFL